MAVTQHGPPYGNLRLNTQWGVFPLWIEQCPKVKAEQSNASLGQDTRSPKPGIQPPLLILCSGSIFSREEGEHA